MDHGDLQVAAKLVEVQAVICIRARARLALSHPTSSFVLMALCAMATSPPSTVAQSHVLYK